MWGRRPRSSRRFGTPSALLDRLGAKTAKKRLKERRQFDFLLCGVAYMAKVKATVFELPQKLGILQYVEYEPERCGGCLHMGLLTAEGCKKGVCVKYRAWVFSRDGRRWEAKERWRKRRDEEEGGCLRQQIADALWELAERGYDIAVDSECGIAINGVAVSRPRCRGVEECAKQMLEEHRKRAESPPPPPRRSPEEEEYETLSQQYAWLEWWNKNAVAALLRQDRRTLLDVLQRLNSTEIPQFVAKFIGRFELDLRCMIEVFSNGNDYCISFCVRDLEPRTYCYAHGKGWHAAQQPKFLRLKPLEDGRLVEIYTAEGKELIRIA